MSWAHDVIIVGSAGLVALAVSVAAQLHLGATSMGALIVSVPVFAGLTVMHLVFRLRAAAPRRRRSRGASPTGANTGKASNAEAAALRATEPVQRAPDIESRAHAGAVPEAFAPSGPTAIDGFEHLQSLVAELARTTRGPKAATPDPDALPIAVETPVIAADAQDLQAAALAQAVRLMGQSGGITPAVVAAELVDALGAERVTVYLEPIQLIETDSPRHFEVSVRFTTAEGDELPHAELLAVARDLGLLARVDAAVLPRAARIAQHFRSRGRRAEILSRVHGGSLPDQDFRAEITAATIAADGAALVLSFAQSDVRDFGPIHWEILSTVSEMGLRFAVEAVTDLEMDFENLKRRGFDFVKLDAEVLLEGLPAAGGLIAAADVCGHFALAGLALIVGHIDDEQALARILGFGVLFGQGTLFGGRRAVRADLLTIAAAA